MPETEAVNAAGNHLANIEYSKGAFTEQSEWLFGHRDPWVAESWTLDMESLMTVGDTALLSSA